MKEKLLVQPAGDVLIHQLTILSPTLGTPTGIDPWKQGITNNSAWILYVGCQAGQQSLSQYRDFSEILAGATRVRGGCEVN
ncbi:MAG: hypothetical protein EKK68_05740 [Candidatus Competibacteraceae bacterium]|nr:MAG: hypothetical protein EKK68_05740 [Candidatus Competibacteraceae bacterium]